MTTRFTCHVSSILKYILPHSSRKTDLVLSVTELIPHYQILDIYIASNVSLVKYCAHIHFDCYKLSHWFENLFYLCVKLDMMSQCKGNVTVANGFLSFALIRHVTLVAITGTTILTPYHIIKSLQLIWISGTRRFHLRVPDLPKSCSDLT